MKPQFDEPLLSESNNGPVAQPSVGAKNDVSFAREEGEENEIQEEEEGAIAVRMRFCWPLFIPGILQGKSTAVITPMLPLFIIQDLHSSVAMVGFMASIYSLAQVWTSIPMGWVLDKIHHRKAAVTCLLVILMSALGTASCHSIIELAVLRFIAGAAANAWNLSRKVWLASEVPEAARGRISSTLTGFSRLASLFAAIISGGVAQYLQTRDVFLVQASLTGCAFLTLLSYNLTHQLPGESMGKIKSKKDKKGSGGSCWEVIRETWYALFTAGGFSLMLNACRQMWMVVLPVQAHTMGLSKMDIGWVIAASRAMDAFMSLGITGTVVDTFGRKTAGVPGMVFVAIAYHLTSIATNIWGLVLASVVYGLGNGCTGGLTNTLSVDICPENNKATFMGIWKMYTSVGSLLAPLVYGILADWFGSPSMATVLVAGLALCAAAWLAFLVPETKPQANGKQGQLARAESEESDSLRRQNSQACFLERQGVVA